MSFATACGKIILFGEHAVVYGRPALAVPLEQLRARATVEPRQEPGTVIHARDLSRELRLDTATVDDPLITIIRLTLGKLGRDANLDITVESGIPVASGLGSGAAVSTAIVRALATFFGTPLSPAEVSALVYETEKLYHGTPSGIDNSVIALEQAIRFVRGHEITPFRIARPFTLAIANTGIASPTKITVGDVRRGWENDPARYEALFDRIGGIVEQAQSALARGQNDMLGELMSRNQRALAELNVSSPAIERMLEVGLQAGAGGGKLSGGGRGGNVIFHIAHERAPDLRNELLRAGAKSVLITTVGS